MSKVLFKPPVLGIMLASIPVTLATGFLKLVQTNDWFDTTENDWSQLGIPGSYDQII